jgi:hypothetical protein
MIVAVEERDGAPVLVVAGEVDRTNCWTRPTP